MSVWFGDHLYGRCFEAEGARESRKRVPNSEAFVHARTRVQGKCHFAGWHVTRVAATSASTYFHRFNGKAFIWGGWAFILVCLVGSRIH